ncbi:MAG: phosphate signaling complex protein PhoU [Bdellovibrionales bacterium]|nr:phosphate signaling complex protein PhoU [Bdellovibrionales bacterium]
MERQIDVEIRELKDLILAMGCCVEKSIEEATQALILREPDRFKKVYELEKTINEHHILVDEACVRILARQSPLAADLRWIVATIKINTDLERMGDQAVNISHNGERYLTEPALKPLIDLPRMASEVRQMVRSCLDAFVRKDLALAEQVLQQDDVVDQLKNEILDELKAFMARDPQSISRALNLILIARNLERLGDHATNIAEDVIYALTGKDIRHGHS